MAERVTVLKVLGIDLDTKLSFESQIKLITATASRNLVIKSKVLCLFDDSASN